MSQIVPLNLGEPQLSCVNAGSCTVLHRPLSRRFASLAAGDRLWIREPFCLPADADRFAPTVAVSLGHLVGFPDHRGAGEWGKVRPARSLPKVAHRQHLLVLDVTRVALLEIPLDQLRAQGFPSATALHAAIQQALAGFASLYAGQRRPDPHSPVLQAIRFQRIAAPVSPKE